MLKCRQLPPRQLYLSAKLRMRFGRGAVSGGTRLLVCQVAHDHGESVESARYERVDLDLRGKRRPIGAQLPAGVTSPSSPCFAEQPRKIRFAKVVEHGRRAAAYHLPAFDTIQARRTGATIADVPRLVEENQNGISRRLIETAQRTVQLARLTLG